MIAYPKVGSDDAETLDNVSEWCKRRFTYVKDSVRWATSPEGLWLTDSDKEHWETDAQLESDLILYGRVIGDCDAYAKLVWKCLRRLGVGSRLVYCLIPDPQKPGHLGGHLVCEAGGMILDNIQIGPTSNTECEKMGYQFLSKSGYQPGGQWTDMT